MERIESTVEPAVVEIDGVEYPVAERTVAVMEALAEAQRRSAGRMEYRLWLAEMEILLGRGAVKKLFPAGRKENVDRIQMIHAGVCRAFERCGNEIDRQRAAERAEVWSDAASALAPVTELLRELARMEAPVIRRGDVRKEDDGWRTE